MRRSSRDFGLLSAPLSYVRSGNYSWSTTNLNNRSSRGYCWSSRSDNTEHSSYLTFNPSNLLPRYNDFRGLGFAVRSRDFGLLSSPLSYVRSGYYDWYSTGLSYRGSYGCYWSLRSANTTASYYLRFNSSYLYPQYGDRRGNGFAVRKKLLTSPNPQPSQLSNSLHPRLRPPQRPIIVCGEWHLRLGLYGAYL